MIITFTLIIASLVALNFFLLFFSCNKTPKKETVNQTAIMSTAHKSLKTAKPMQKLATSTQLAPTGS